MPPQGGPQHADLTPAPAGQAPAPPPPSGAKPDRRAFDNARVKARFVDWVIWLAIYLLFARDWMRPDGQIDLSHTVIVIALYVSYFFFCEALWGQTLGKRLCGVRVTRSDGGGTPGLNSIATRNVIRVVEEPLIAVFVMAGSRGRRQRVGDLVSGTCVVASENTPAPASPGPKILAYPAIWAIGIVIFLTLVSNDGKSSPSSNFPSAADYEAQAHASKNALTPEGQRFTEMVNRSCSDGLHAQTVAVGEVLSAAKAAGTAQNQVAATADRALATELRGILNNAEKIESPAEMSPTFSIWRGDLRFEIMALLETANATGRGDAAEVSEIARRYTPQLLELTQLSAQLGFDECLPKDISGEFST